MLRTGDSAVDYARLLQLSVAMNDPGRGISVADTERRLLITMPYVVWAGIDGWIFLIIGKSIILTMKRICDRS